MKKIALLLFLIQATSLQAQVRDWENPQVLGINKLSYHATLQLPSKPHSEVVSLDGQWYFHWSPNPWERPVGFEDTDYDVSSWNKIAVPGNWQMQGLRKAHLHKHFLSLSAQ